MQYRAEHGFTLIELMVTVSVLAVLAAVAAPSFSEFNARQSLRSASFDLTTDLVLARSEAIKRNASITIAATGGSWSNGWSVIVAATSEQLRSADALSNHVAVSGAPTSLTFNRLGRIAGVTGTQEFDLSATAYGATLHRCIALDPSGLPKVFSEAC